MCVVKKRQILNNKFDVLFFFRLLDILRLLTRMKFERAEFAEYFFLRQITYEIYDAERPRLL